jgi:uncharacterized damage-inducible protein DinB
MNRDDLETLLDYHYWARDRMLEAIAPLNEDEFTRDLGSSFKSIRDTVVHTYSAEWVWLQRLNGTSPTSPIPFDRFDDVATLRKAWVELESEFRAHLHAKSDADLAGEIDYRNIAGVPGRSVISHIIQQVINHATYHRGQVTTMLRQLGATGLKGQDLIAYHRERSQ